MMADQPDDGQVPHSERYVYWFLLNTIFNRIFLF
jgi:hypothetical protein